VASRVSVSVCLSVCLSAAACPHNCTDPDVTSGSGRACPLVVHYMADLQSVNGLRCYDNITRTRNVSEYMLVLALCQVTFRVSRRRREMYCGHARLCVCLSVCVCVSVRGRMSTLSHGPGCNLGSGRGMECSWLCTIGRICNRYTGCVAMAT